MKFSDKMKFITHSNSKESNRIPIKSRRRPNWFEQTFPPAVANIKLRNYLSFSIYNLNFGKT
jgi:hypothetical protein